MAGVNAKAAQEAVEKAGACSFSKVHLAQAGGRCRDPASLLSEATEMQTVSIFVPQ